MKYNFLPLYYIAFVLLSTIVTITHCCSSRRMPQRRPPSSSSTNIRTHEPRIIITNTHSDTLLPSSVSSPSLSPVPTTSVKFTDNYPSVSISSSSSSSQPGVVQGGQPVTSTTSTSTSTTQETRRPSSGGTTTTINDSNCTSDYRKHYCLNNGICFNYTIQQNFTLLSCLCADGFYGERCEDKYLEGSYSTKMRSNKHIMLHIASIQYGLVASMAVVLVVFYVKSYVTTKYKLTSSKK
uniref:CSON010720 protein n=1 Tax=Culicoides sonorensis TaxID=179676 RepID=A0A336ME79_CULSO